MSEQATLAALRSEMEAELRQRILPFWMERAVDAVNGGFVGLIDAEGHPHHDAPKGSILNARILWTFSAAFRALGAPEYAAAAQRAAAHFRARFVDPLHGGVRWMTAADGTPTDERKHVYAQAFAVYALSEHFRATGDEGSLREAVAIFRLVETHAHVSGGGGYLEAFARNWTPLEDVRLSEVDEDAPRSMNTHLHVLEAYASLYRVWPEALLGERLREVIGIFLDRIVDPASGHVHCFFDERWKPTSEVVSYGHDIETSWLLVEAAEVLGDTALLARVRETAVRIADAVLRTGFDPAGGLFHEGGPDGVHDRDKEWWPQAEAVVGFLNAHELTGRADFLAAAASTWAFVRDHFVDHRGGEWHRRTAPDGTVRPGHEKVGPWKCPYHNGRACVEVMARVPSVAAAGPAMSVRS